jgi:hypothetical protein
MYVSLFDIDLNHITNLSNITGTLITKVYDFDEIKLSGNDTMGANINELNQAKWFRINEDDGAEIYSGLVYKVKKIGNIVEIIGEDFREILSNEIVLDFVVSTPPTSVFKLFDLISNYFINTADITLNKIPLEFINYGDSANITNLFGDPSGNIIATNAYTYLLPYIKYFEYMLHSRFDWGAKKIIFGFTKTRNYHSIKLRDFEHKLSSNEPNVNKAIAILKFAEFGYEWVKQEYGYAWEDVMPLTTQYSAILPSGDDTNRWVKTGNTQYIYKWVLQEIYYDTIPPIKNTCPTGYVKVANPDLTFSCVSTTAEWRNVTPEQYVWSVTKPNADDGYRWVQEGDSNIIFEWKLQQLVDKWVNVEPKETQLSPTQPEESDPNFQWVMTGETQAPLGATRYYYLTNDNQIVESDQYGNIPNRYYPVKTKIFIEDYLAHAQQQAVYELANNRYVDSIMIDANSPLNPIDLSKVGLFDLIEIYDTDYQKTLPVSEKHLKISEKGIEFKLKLGFKKERLTEIIRYTT